MKQLALAVAVVLLAGLVAPDGRTADAPKPKPMTLAEAAKFFGYTDDELSRIEKGEIVSKALKEGSDKELAAVVAFTVPKTVAEAAAAALSGEMFKFDRTTYADQVWATNVEPDVAFADLAYTADDAKEVAALLKVTEGSKFNFSKDEVGKLQAAAKQIKKANGKDPATQAAMSAAMREILKARYLAYRDRGLDGIAPYSRGGKKVATPGKEQALALNAALPVSRFPQGHRALANYPKDPMEGLEHRFFWYKKEVAGRPAFILSHRVAYEAESAAMMAERQYYVGSSYNSMLIVAGAFAIDGGSLVFYTDRTFTDQVAGFGSGMKHGIGRKQMIAAIETWFKKVKKELGE